VRTANHDLRRRAAAVLGFVAVVAPLAACTSPTPSDSRSAMQRSAAAPGLPTPSDALDHSAPSAPARGVACDPHTCTLTLRTTDPQEVEAFGAPLTLEGIQDGVASLLVGDARVECVQNQAVRAGSRTLFCADVRADGVTITAEVG
jgi:hypothetical protein